MRCSHGGGDPRGCLLCFKEEEAKKPRTEPPPKAPLASVQARAEERNRELMAMSRIIARKDEMQAHARAVPRAIALHPSTFPDWERVMGFPIYRVPELPPGMPFLIYDV